MSRSSQATYARCALEAAIDEIDELLHVNKYNTGRVYNARHYATQALLEIERLEREEKGIIV